ncbi:glutathione S-transferase family protein [Kangiella sp. TOML190]|uniref:glutathione S-transferase family protein n=1 Tax=Kangiella sp. TOML190 TaxID=2931351 RepID=UPI00203B306E|nr:glutathione S-transferase family protein [Kangiella sp. TOML190]
MITLHHLNQSRSKRIIWLLEELGLEYKLIPYQRDAVTFLAPPELKSVHPLGKSPVVEDKGVVIAESAAITDYLIEKYGQGRLAPEKHSHDHIEYMQWLHFAESSGVLPLLLQTFIDLDKAETTFLKGYADSEARKIMSYLDQSMHDKTFLVGETLSGADIMISFILEWLHKNGSLADFPNLESYYKRLLLIPAYQKANLIEAEHANTD